MTLPVVLYVGLWANPPFTSLSERFAHMRSDCAQAGYDLRVWHWDHPGDFLAEDALPVGVILSGSRFDLPCATDPSRAHRPLYDYRPLLARLIEWRIPVLGICYGHQLMALHEGCTLGLLADKRRCNDHPITVVEDDPILGEAGNVLQVPENHRMLVETVDKARWEIVAVSDDGIEALRHRLLPWLGVQFHPEYHPESQHDHARQVFANWLTSLASQPAEVVVR
ncbi:MAG: hypothetical protein EA401_08380 [Planctomycetota bacterium]|nr:MAG: hypothetical protein EA401_08380 [Planctomycetota bacterium]